MNSKQKEVLRFIKNFIKKKGYSPTNDEIKEATGLKSKPMVNHYLNSLELLGKIKRDKYKHRNITIIKPTVDDNLIKKLKHIAKELNEFLEEIDNE